MKVANLSKTNRSSHVNPPASRSHQKQPSPSVTGKERRWRQTNTRTWRYGQRERLKDRRVTGFFLFFFSPSLLQLLLIHSTITQSVLREEKRFSGQIDSVLAFNYNKRKKTEHLLMEQVSTKCSHLIVHAVLLMCFSVLFLYFFSCLSVSLSVYGYACWEINPQPFF